MSRYIFAVTEDADPLELPEGVVGFEDAPIEPIAAGGLAAITCEFDGSKKLRPRRRNLKVHHEAVNTLLEHADVLPMSFGAIAEGDEQVRDFLTEYAPTLRAQLDRTRGRVEISLVLRWDVEDIFAHMIELDEPLRQRRDALFGHGGEPDREAKIELGRLFAERLEAHRVELAERAIAALEPACVMIHQEDPRTEDEIARLAFLIDRDATAEFERAVEALAPSFADEILFKLAGPIAPYSFIDVHLEG